jgi:hypothetical protein
VRNVCRLVSGDRLNREGCYLVDEAAVADADRLDMAVAGQRHRVGTAAGTENLTHRHMLASDIIQGVPALHEYDLF